MKTRTLILIATTAGVGGGIAADNLAAMYVALAGGGIVYMLHAIEVKLNRLLDQHGIKVFDSDIAKD